MTQQELYELVADLIRYSGLLEELNSKIKNINELVIYNIFDKKITELLKDSKNIIDELMFINEMFVQELSNNVKNIEVIGNIRNDVFRCINEIYNKVKEEHK